MEEVRRLSSGGSALGKASASSLWSHGEPRHSTPVKAKDEGASFDVRQTAGGSSFPVDSRAQLYGTGSSPLWAPSMQEAQFPAADFSSSTIQRQRRELQLLVAELKDREKELNAMAASHLKQHRAWEQNRQRALTLEQRCARLDEEVQKRNEVIRVLTKHVGMVETREKEAHRELSEARQQLRELEKKQQHIHEKCQDFEEKNQSLSSTVTALSTQVGSLQVREEELSSMLKLKDQDVAKASGHMVDLSGRLQDLETCLKESRSQESKLREDSEENRLRYKEAGHKVRQLKEELQQQVAQSSTQREEIIRLKQELQLLQGDALTGGGDSCKDELLELARSKQERLTSELRCLRQVCENQQSELQLMQLTCETLRERISQGSLSSQDELTCTCESPCSLRGKSLKPEQDVSPLPAAGLQGSGRCDPGVFSAHFLHGGAPLSGCPLQQLLDESKLVVGGSGRLCSSLQNSSHTVSCSTTDPLCFQDHQTPQHHPSSSILKTSPAPPKTCPRHGTNQPAHHGDFMTQH